MLPVLEPLKVEYCSHSIFSVLFEHLLRVKVQRDHEGYQLMHIIFVDLN